MSNKTNISWTDHTYNPWIGCTKVSPGCAHCYAQQDQEGKKKRVVWGEHGARIQTTSTDNDPFRWNAAAKRDGVRRRVFCASLADVFDGHPSIQASWKTALWVTIRGTPDLDWLLLTKRPERIRSDVEQFTGGKLPANVWLGFSAENQELFDLRWSIFRDIGSSVRFVSCEPALGPIALNEEHRGTIDWMIYGGETSLRRNVSRPATVKWALDLRDDCRRLGIAFWFKQHGNWMEGAWRGKGSAVYKNTHDRLDGRVVHELPQTRRTDRVDAAEVVS